MTRGKSICNVLKTIRTQIAKANEIKYEPCECHHTGECRGTCPACEAEVRYIERQLDIRRQLGKAVTIIGISAGMAALSGCGDKAKKVEEVERDSLTVGKVLVEPQKQAVELENNGGQKEEQKVQKANGGQKKQKVQKAEAYDEVIGRTGGVSDTIEMPVVPLPLPLPQTNDENQIYGVVEQMPMFPGGQKALMEFLAQHIQYPKEMEETCVQGRVIVTFVVEKDGSITEAKVVKSVHPALDQEALRVVGLMPKWIPGSQNGVRFRVKYTIPVTFRLQ